MNAHTEASADSGESNSRATNPLAGVVRAAMNRNGSRDGFDFVAVSLTWRKLLETDDQYDGSIFFTPVEHIARFQDCYSTSESRTKLILVLLLAALRSEDRNAADLAARIGERMMETAAHDQISRPHLYMSTTTEGFAAVIAIYDEFWTDRW
ncbi:hypothetical protein [Nocardia fluminea]|uniref:hypothetical protein n=1 Tax=Nocardia fluminea TaxID=134984 RepID=UPI003D146902